MNGFATTKLHADLDFVTLGQKLDGLFDANGHIMGIGVHVQPDLFDLALLLALARLTLAFGGFVLESPIIHQFADRWYRLRLNFHQIQVAFARQVERPPDHHDADLLAVFANDTHFAGTNALIDPLFFGTIVVATWISVDI